MASRVSRIFLPAREHLGNTNIMRCQPIDAAAWIWHGQVPDDEPVFLRFRCVFAAADLPLVLHVSADERYVLLLDGQRISRGPDRGDLDHWHYATYRVALDPGPHTLEAWCWRLLNAAPLAQLSWRGGFILAAEGPYDAALTTGKAPWQVVRLVGQRPVDAGNPDCFGVGAALEWDARMYPWTNDGAVAAVVVREPVRDKPWGVVTPGWRLTPSALPDQLDRGIRAGRIVAGGAGILDRDTPVSAEALQWSERAAWQAVVAGTHPVTVPPHTTLYVIWDLDEYYCAYPCLEVDGGRDARTTWGWSEAPYAADGRSKGHRGEIAGKRFVCFADHFIADGGTRRFTTHWWRCGRYCVITVVTAAAPLTITSLSLDETRYPLEMTGRLETPDAGLPAVVALCVRGLQMCSHETYLDCPYYEQLMYVGDTRLELLTTYVTTDDDRLARQALRLLDASRVNWGFVNERYPCREPQHSVTFALLWALVLRDYAWWRNDPAFVCDRLIGLRSMLEHCAPYRNSDGLLEGLPGWSFIDWVPEWEMGCAPDGQPGVSSLNNLLYVLALQAATDLEALAGEPLLARRYTQQARVTGRAIVARFWDRRRGLVANELAHATFSEHGQALALLSGVVTGARAWRVLRGLLEASDLHRASHYFSFYVFEALRAMGQGQRILPQLARWKAMVAQGCRTPPETYEPSRSDCHAWSSQPLFHLYATIAGIRPASPGFRTVRIEPQLGDWPRIAGALPHPNGAIEFDFDARRCRATVILPAGIHGTLLWQACEVPLTPGRQEIDL